ncbi:hypothetical protein J5X98_25040 [Leptothermofonsia sichuanensis E412]|uniref:hypothetical protein n=1 Tax=Leptothermofonsia sichuanensis TaxID=2917832 RepID=UPI001CA78F5B|nr:hypothetical protein [Leptothermofonsia sichuanensis]QZZ20465.1 hypothetical protein J5X98_25040 [Leptothermofonsia sichuanensis E412]
MGLTGEVHYWLARTLLAREQLDNAIALIQPVFEDGSLPKDYSICYAKLLLLKGNTATVEHLLNNRRNDSQPPISIGCVEFWP